MSEIGGETPLVIEVSWEACSQAGGIYTVLRTKCAAGLELCGDHYCLFGPYHEAAAKIEFEPEPQDGLWGEVVDEVAQTGVKLHLGRWIVTGMPRVVLVDLNSIRPQIPKYAADFWKTLGVSQPGRDSETEEHIAFGKVVADLLGCVRRRLPGRSLLAQCHEWQGAAAIPILKHNDARIPTIFTTHATLVGRSLSAANQNIYGNLDAIDPLAVAREHGIESRYRVERAATECCDVFTTVSGITGQEAAHFLGRQPDFLLPNGLNVQRSAAAPHEFQNLHQKCKQKIHEFTIGHFFPSYTFDLSKTLYFFVAGRYEYRNKGIDVFIEALDELNRRLKAESTGVTVVAFVIARAPYHAYNIEVLNRQAMLHELKGTCEVIEEQMGERLFRTVIEGRLPKIDDLLEAYNRVRLQRMIHAWHEAEGNPSIVTHDLVDGSHDPVLQHLAKMNLHNTVDDPVKLVFHPQFIKMTSPILGMEYDDFVRGSNLGVFPSYYEPWGYTPMEAIVRGIPAITSDLSGFGMYLKDRFPDHDSNGMYVTRRRDVSFADSVYQVAGWMHSMTKMSLRDRIRLRGRVESYAEYFDWSQMARNYHAARRAALEKYHPDREFNFSADGV